MAIFDTSIGCRSAAFNGIAESAERVDRLSRIGEVASAGIFKMPSSAIATHLNSALALHSKLQSALEPIRKVTKQLQRSESQLQTAIAPVHEATERLKALSEAIHINITFRHLGEAAGAFTQIRHLEELTGDRILKIDEDHFINKIALSNAYESIGVGAKLSANFLPFEPLSNRSVVRYTGEPNNSYKAFEDQSSLPDFTTACQAEYIIKPIFRAVPDYRATIVDKNLSIEERCRAFALSGLPVHYFFDYFLDEDFDLWVEREVETAKRHRERILSFIIKINQIYRRASRRVLQAYRRLTKIWKNASIFSWRHADLNQTNTIKDAGIKLSHFFISITPRYSRVLSFFYYEFCRKHDFPPAGYRIHPLPPQPS